MKPRGLLRFEQGMGFEARVRVEISNLEILNVIANTIRRFSSTSQSSAKRISLESCNRLGELMRSIIENEDTDFCSYEKPIIGMFYK